MDGGLSDYVGGVGASEVLGACEGEPDEPGGRTSFKKQNDRGMYADS